MYGRGAKGGRGRCYGLWSAFSACAEQHSKYKFQNECRIEREDYIECLHHTKLVSRSNSNTYKAMCHDPTQSVLINAVGMCGEL